MVFSQPLIDSAWFQIGTMTKFDCLIAEEILRDFFPTVPARSNTTSTSFHIVGNGVSISVTIKDFLGMNFENKLFG